MDKAELKKKILEYIYSKDNGASISELAEDLDIDFKDIGTVARELQEDELISSKTEYGSGGNSTLKLLTEGRKQVEQSEIKIPNVIDERPGPFSITNSNIAIGSGTITTSESINTESASKFPWVKSIVVGLVVAVLVAVVTWMLQ